MKEELRPISTYVNYVTEHLDYSMQKKTKSRV